MSTFFDIDNEINSNNLFILSARTTDSESDSDSFSR